MLMARFDATHRGSKQNRWFWALATAAIFVFAIVLLQRLPRHTAPVIPGTADSTLLATAESQDDGFIPVPYVPPLAPGEQERIVHTELYPAALASLGISVDPAWTAAVSADLLVGQDGFPRAVRIADITERII